MIKIIDGKRYNTETAEFVGEWSNHYGVSDFQYCEETLYRTKKGAWFIAGEGGPMSKYSMPCGNNCWSGGSDIRALADAEAKAWLEAKGLFDELEEHFGSELEDA